MSRGSIQAIFSEFMVKKRVHSKTTPLLRQPWLWHLVSWGFIVLAGACILYLRYPFSYTLPNFYAEDGTVFARNLYENGMSAIFMVFNGYLVLGQYLVAGLGFVINSIAGSGLVTLPKAMAMASYMFFAAACSLPWLLFRRKLGIPLSLLAVILLLLTPLGRSDYTVLGTIGNLKFVFLYIAVMFLAYRHHELVAGRKGWRVYLADIVVAICVLTNILVVALLPFALIAHKKQLKRAFDRRSLHILSNDRHAIVALLLILSAVIYAAAMYLAGIPKMEGYLDGPLRLVGVENALYRSSWYGVLYPLHTTLNHVTVSLILILSGFGVYALRRKPVVLLGAWAVIVSTLGFVFNRPGVTEFLLKYTPDGGPGQFFYGGTMVFTFCLIYVLSDHLKNIPLRRGFVFIVLVATYLAWAVPYAGERARSAQLYSSRPDIYHAVLVACAAPGESAKVTIPVYPVDGWNLVISREIACQKQ